MNFFQTLSQEPKKYFSEISSSKGPVSNLGNIFTKVGVYSEIELDEKKKKFMIPNISVQHICMSGL